MTEPSIQKMVDIIAKQGDSTAVEICDIKNRETKPHREILCHALRCYGFNYGVIGQIIAGVSLQTLRNYAAKELSAEQNEILKLIKEKTGDVLETKKFMVERNILEAGKEIRMKKEDITPIIAQAITASGVDGIEEFCLFIGYKVRDVLLWREGIGKTPVHFRKVLGFIIHYGIKQDNTHAWD